MLRKDVQPLFALDDFTANKHRKLNHIIQMVIYCFVCTPADDIGNFGEQWILSHMHAHQPNHFLYKSSVHASDCLCFVVKSQVKRALLQIQYLRELKTLVSGALYAQSPQLAPVGKHSALKMERVRSSRE